MKENPSSQSQPILEEAMRLFQAMHFSHIHGAYAEGQYVAVSVDPRWNDNEETFRTMISCIALGHRRVDWERLPVQISPEQGGGMHTLTRLDARGQALIPHLPPGEYRLALRLKQLRVAPVLSQPLEKLAAQGEDDAHERRVWQGKSEDGVITWSLEETEEGDVQIAFETQAAQLSGHTLIFQLLDPTNQQTRYSRQLVFQPTRTPNKWEAWCVIGSHSEFPGPYELMFALEPFNAPDTEG